MFIVVDLYRRTYGIPAAVSSPVRQSTIESRAGGGSSSGGGSVVLFRTGCRLASDDTNPAVSLFGQRPRRFRFDQTRPAGHIARVERDGRSVARRSRHIARHPLQTIAGRRFRPAEFATIFRRRLPIHRLVICRNCDSILFVVSHAHYLSGFSLTSS